MEYYRKVGINIMKVVDARGLSCPEPIMLTNEALKSESAVTVLVDEAHQKTNVEKFASEKGKKTSVTDKDGYFEIIVE
ncbi:tRNA 2-thiouridine synthesizing protein A [Lachnospiraceae bacterium PM6-15]